MPFQDYFGVPVAIDPDTGRTVPGATFTAHTPDDISLATPLATTDPVTGSPVDLITNLDGILPDFRVAGDLPQVIIKSGSHVTKITSIYGAVLAAGLDPDTVAAAIQAAADAQAAVIPGLHAQNITGAVTVPVTHEHTYELNATAPATVTLDGAPGCQAAIIWSGSAGTLEGTATTAGQTYVAVRLTAGWQIYTVGAAGPAPDTTPPTAGTLTVAVTTTTAGLTVTGAADETALHATPFAFSKDNGATWTAWQTAATYQFTGLASSTSFTFQHRVRDAAGNVKTGTAVVKSTVAPPTWIVWAADDFTGSDGTIVGRATPTGGKVWVAPTGGDLGYPTWSHGESAAIGSNKLVLTGSSWNPASAGIPYPPVGTDGRVRVTVDYDLTVDPNASLSFLFPSNNWPQPFSADLRMGQVATFDNQSGDSWTVTPGAAVPPNSGTAVAECSRNAAGELTFQLTVGGTLILAATGTGTSGKPSGAKVQIGVGSRSVVTGTAVARVDNLKVEYVA